MSQADLNVEVQAATAADEPVLRKLMQLYCYDFSEFVEMPFNADGTFANTEFVEEQFGPSRDTFVIRVDEQYAGFAIVSAKSYVNDEEGIFDMAQFFVMRAHRRKNVGQIAAAQLFDRFPGPWEVRVIKENKSARKFWRSIIDNYTNGNFGTEETNGGRHQGTVFRLVSG